MKELMATGRNIFLVFHQDAFHPTVELSLTLSEPCVKTDPGGRVVRICKTESIHFCTDPEGLRKLADKCEAWATEAELALEKALEKAGKAPKGD